MYIVLYNHNKEPPEVHDRQTLRDVWKSWGNLRPTLAVILIAVLSQS